MLLSQIQHDSGKTAVVVRSGTEAALLGGVDNLPQLAALAMSEGRSLLDQIARQPLCASVDLPALQSGGCLLPISRFGGRVHVAGSAPPGHAALARLMIIGPGGVPFVLGHALAWSAARDEMPTIGPELRVSAWSNPIRGQVRLTDRHGQRKEASFLCDSAQLALNETTCPPGQPGDLSVRLVGFELPLPGPVGPGDRLEIEAPEFGLPLSTLIVPLPGNGLSGASH